VGSETIEGAHGAPAAGGTEASGTTGPAAATRLIRAQRTVEGDGFVVQRPFPTPQLSYVDPFLLFDQMGPTEFGPGQGVGTSWHPHRGFETVTYLLEGDAEHRDSMGNHGHLGPGDTQWMTAGSGVLHKEGPSAAANESGGRMHGLQLWVNLPAAEKMTAPAYQDLRAGTVARREVPGATIRVIAGRLFDLQGPGATRTPISYAHVTLARDATVRTELPAGHTVLVYPMAGAFRTGATEVGESTLAIMGPGSHLELVGTAESSEIIVLSGLPIGEPVARYGPFVMNTQVELEQAFADYRAGAFGRPPD
jgi:redox-sensitive bicupin YhaK (pirin superfamily)